ncbi:MAG: LptF/LptG family permease [Thermogutta sp.]|nr:LptF/LptG family permease [Thermogutta sp.]
MKIIDRYILFHFFQSFFLAYLSLTCVFVVFDFFTNMDEFSRGASQAGGLFRLAISFYGPQSLAFLERVLGLLTLSSALFTVAWLQRHNEMTALLAAGISRLRVVGPILIGAMIAILLGVPLREIVLPQLRDALARTSKDPFGQNGKPIQPRYDNQTEILFRGKAGFRKDRRISEPSLLLPPELDAYGGQLQAENAYYRPPQPDRPGGFLLDKMIRPTDLASQPSLELKGKTVIITPKDAPWLRSDQCFVVTDMDYDQLAGDRVWLEYSSTATLIRGLHNPSLDLGADVRVRIHSRLVQPIRDLTLLFLGLPLLLRREQRNVFLALGLGLAIVIVFTTVVLAWEYLGANETISPALAAWGPLFIFVPFAAAWLDWIYQ